MYHADQSDTAYETVVARMLDDPEHGVRYAGHWLDVMRYADVDENMPAQDQLHRWRDWVISALNEDVPYDDFAPSADDWISKCPDHYYDPIEQRDFYAMKALFDPLVLQPLQMASAGRPAAAGLGNAGQPREDRAVARFADPAALAARLDHQRTLGVVPCSPGARARRGSGVTLLATTILIISQDLPSLLRVFGTGASYAGLLSSVLSE